MRSGNVSRTPQEKLGRADSQAGAWSTRVYIPGSRYNLRGAGTSHRGGAFRRRRTPGPRKRSGRSLPSLLSQPGRTRHMRCFHRLPVNRGCAHRRLGSAPYPTPAETRWTGTPATVHLGGLDTGALTAHVVDRHMQPSRRLTRKADDLPWSVSVACEQRCYERSSCVRVAWPEVAGPRGFFRHLRPGLAGDGLVRCRPCWATLSSSPFRSTGPRSANSRGGVA